MNSSIIRRSVRVYASDKEPNLIRGGSRRQLLMSGVGCCPCCMLASGNSTSKAGWYDRFLAYALAKGMDRYEKAITPVKERLFTQLSNNLQSVEAPVILDVGLGAGPNLQYLSSALPNAEVVGLEPNPAMQQYCKENADAAGLGDRFQFVEGVAESMPFVSGAFDAAVITLVLCSVPDVPAALSEIRRVVKPGGKVLVVEHVVSPRSGTLRLQQRVLDPLQQLIAGGCHLTRDTAGALEAAGMRGVGGLLRFDVDGMWVIGPHVAGVLEV